MKLKNLQITNFRCFESLSIDFDEKLTVLVAENGTGKTAILDAIAVALSPFISGFDTGVGKNFKPDDARLSIIESYLLTEEGFSLLTEDGGRIIINTQMEAQYPIILRASGFLNEQAVQWSRELTGKKTQTTSGKAKVLNEYAKELQNQVREGENTTLPIIAYYGTGRLWKQAIHKKFDKSSLSRLYGYYESLNPDSTYKAFTRWFSDMSIALNSQPNRVNPKTLESVRKATNQCLSISEWENLQYDLIWHELVLYQKNTDKFIPIALQSDGVKAMLSLTADIAYRCIQLNPHLAFPPEETTGIVLIDEIDLHLHPKWQQTVLSDLCKAFPKIQFIVTTHSPQVLSSIHRKSIRLLGKDVNGKDVAVMPTSESYGELSSDVLESIMHVNPQPPVPEKSKLERLTELVDQGLYQTTEAVNLLAELKTALNETHPQLQKLQRSIKRQEMLKA